MGLSLNARRGIQVVVAGREAGDDVVVVVVDASVVVVDAAVVVVDDAVVVVPHLLKLVLVVHVAACSDLRHLGLVVVGPDEDRGRRVQREGSGQSRELLRDAIDDLLCRTL